MKSVALKEGGAEIKRRSAPKRPRAVGERALHVVQAPEEVVADKIADTSAEPESRIATVPEDYVVPRIPTPLILEQRPPGVKAFHYSAGLIDMMTAKTLRKL